MDLKINVDINDKYLNKMDLNLHSPRINFKISPEEENELDINDSDLEGVESNRKITKISEISNANSNKSLKETAVLEQQISKSSSDKEKGENVKNLEIQSPQKLQDIDLQQQDQNEPQNQLQQQNQEDNYPNLMTNSNMNRINAMKKRQQSILKRKKAKVIMSTIFKVAFHYMDSLTDIFLIIEYINLSAGRTDNFQALLYYGICTMNLLVCYGADRLFSYLFLIQNKQTQDNVTISQIKQSARAEKEQAATSISKSKINGSKSLKDLIQLKELTKTEKCKMFLITITLSDYVYILFNETKNPDEMQQKLIKKSLIELICENFMFLFGSTQLYVFKYIQGTEHGFMDYLAIFTSLLSSAYVIYSMANLRQQEDPFLVERDEIKYSEMTVETQRYVSNPYLIAHFKQIGHKKFKYNQISHLECDMENSEIHKPLPFFKKLYILFIVLNEMFAMVILFNLQNGIESMIGSYLRFCQGLFACIPQILIYLSTFTKAKQKKFLEEQEQNDESVEASVKNTTLKQQITKACIAFPYLYIVGCIQFRFPLFMQCFPLVKQVKENWVMNFNPHWYVVCFRLMCQWYDVWSVYVIMTQKITHSQMEAFYTQEDIELRIHSEDTMLWQLFFLGLACQSLSTVYNALDILQRYLRTRAKLINRQKKESEIVSQISGAISTRRDQRIEIQE